MAKIQGPLCSVGASGTVAELLTFRQTRAGPVCQLPGIPTGPATPAQAAERARFAQAMHAWAGLDALVKIKWQTAALQFARQPVVFFASEYLLQRIVPPALPLIPATY